MSQSVEEFVPENMRGEPPPPTITAPGILPPAPYRPEGPFWKVAAAVFLILAVVCGAIAINKSKRVDETGWRYRFDDVTLTDHLSADMAVYANRKLSEDLEHWATMGGN